MDLDLVTCWTGFISDDSTALGVGNGDVRKR
jgi:hypothetical protein